MKSKYLDFLSNETSRVTSRAASKIDSPAEDSTKFKKRNSIVLRVETRPESEFKSPPSKIKRFEPENSTTLANKFKQFLVASSESKLAIM